LSGDGCSETCQVEEDFKCTGGNETTKDYCNNTLLLEAKIKILQYEQGKNSIIAKITFTKEVASLNSSKIDSWLSLSILDFNKTNYNYSIRRETSKELRINLTYMDTVQNKKVRVEFRRSEFKDKWQNWLQNEELTETIKD
jgi:hypothetical protein